jgi:hypothetical protein
MGEEFFMYPPFYRAKPIEQSDFEYIFTRDGSRLVNWSLARQIGCENRDRRWEGDENAWRATRIT